MYIISTKIIAYISEANFGETPIPIDESTKSVFNSIPRNLSL